MTEEQKQTIEHFRNVGLGYRKIGIVLDISRDKARNLRVHPRSRNSAAMTVTFGTGFGEKRTQRRL